MSRGLKEIIPYLRCPITGQNLVILSKDVIDRLNKKISNGQLYFANGLPAKGAIKAGLVTKNRKYIYLVKDEIILLLPDFAIPKQGKITPGSKFKPDSVQAFYDKTGWKKSGNQYEDAIRFEDLREVTKDYVHRCHKRLNKHLPKKGKFIVDIASGPVQNKEYLEYSRNFDYRVCVDFSLLALREAKNKLGSKGIYILGDITNIPLVNNSMDCVISLHTIYHVASNLQAKAFLEVFRILKPGSRVVVVYTWANSELTSLLMSPVLFIGRIKKIFFHNPAIQISELYFNPRSYSWFSRHRWSFKYQIYCWRSIDVNVSKLYIQEWFFGKLLLRILFYLEGRFSNLFGKIGQYPIIVINKDEKSN